jgi:hypothetical protein
VAQGPRKIFWVAKGPPTWRFRVRMAPGKPYVLLIHILHKNVRSRPRPNQFSFRMDWIDAVRLQRRLDSFAAVGSVRTAVIDGPCRTLVWRRVITE